ncbi:MAG: AAA family ATPase [Lentisphaerae bacterium]|nr:AAA family ATPase [Lentisphaerota bacterium]
MLFNRIKIDGMLSFGPGAEGLDLELAPLNILVGANGSGKSNLLEAFSLLHASPVNLPSPVKEMGGVKEWLWKGETQAKIANLEAIINVSSSKQPVRHTLSITEHGGRFEVVDERVENEKPYQGQTNPYLYYAYRHGNPVLNDFSEKKRALKRENVNPEESILSQFKDPERYPVLSDLAASYRSLRLYRNFIFGPNASLRREQSSHGRSDFLVDGGENLSLVISKIQMQVRKELIASLRKLYEEITDIHLQIDGGNVLLFLEEGSGRHIPSTRLSDGTLRYLCLLAILLHPSPPQFIAIEEPEIGLHPDLIPELARLLRAASQRTQLVVTTHSRMLIDAFNDEPESVVVCEKYQGVSRFHRLSADGLKGWLEKYSLGQLWSMGEIGGNRW